jgi:orotate phosphoribosyltransferase-like protein
MSDTTRYEHLIGEVKRLQGRGQTYYEIAKGLRIDRKTAVKLAHLPTPALSSPPLSRGQIAFALREPPYSI